jgi:hypothetical protein
MPYSEHPLFRLPPDTKVIWRYMDFTKFLSLISSRALYFASILRMSELDAFEGLYTRANIAWEEHVQHMSFEEIPEDWKKSFVDKAQFEEFLKAKLFTKQRMFNKGQRAITYVNCWHESPYESAAMWQTYLKSDEGIAIQSTTERLKESLKKYEDFDVNIGEVTYVDFDSAVISLENMLSPFIHKRRSFEYEHELRALIWGPQANKMNLHKPEEAPPGLSVAIDLDILIEKIYASPKAEQWFVDLISSVSTHYNLKKEIVQSDLASKLY